jgi:hypothetical protein
MEDNPPKNGRRPQKKMEDDLKTKIKNGRRPKQKTQNQPEEIGWDTIVNLPTSFFNYG